MINPALHGTKIDSQKPELWKVVGVAKCVRRDSKVSFLSEDITSFMLTAFVSGLD